MISDIYELQKGIYECIISKSQAIISEFQIFLWQSQNSHWWMASIPCESFSSLHVEHVW